MTLAEIIAELRRPFPAASVSFKVQATMGEKALIVAYLDARQVAERLNRACPDDWQDDYKVISDTAVECGITIRDKRRADVGIYESGFGGLKAVYSDAFKRAAVKWGVGTSIYATPRVYVAATDLSKGRMNAKVEEIARKSYDEFMTKQGYRRFGVLLGGDDMAIEHGDTTVEQGDIEVGDEPAVNELPDGDPAKPTGEERMEMVRAQYRAWVAFQLDATKAKEEFQLWLNAEGIDLNSLEDDLAFDKVMERLG